MKRPPRLARVPDSILIYSMIYDIVFGLVRWAVADSVAEKALTFNSFQQPRNFPTVYLKDLQEEFRLTHLVPNQTLGPMEIY